MRKLLAATATILILALSPAGPAAAQSYPSKPIRIVVPFGAGSATDVLARAVGHHMSQSLGQSVVIDNKPGADGAIAAMDVKRSAPDGYSLLMGTNSPLVVAYHLQKQPTYDPIRDFTPVSFCGSAIFFVAVHPSVPAKTLSEFFAHAKANPGKVKYATGNTLSIVASAMLASRTGVQMLQIPYKSEPQAVSELITGATDMIVGTYSTLAGHIRDGKVRALATILPERTTLFPDVPSIVETGMEKLPISPWGALFGPAGMPKEIVDKLAKEVQTILAKPEVKDQILKLGLATRSSTPDELATFLKDELVAWGKAMKEAGLEPQ